MSEKLESLYGDKVSLYLNGGHKITGHVMYINEKEVSIETEDGILIAERKYVSGILVYFEKEEESIVPFNPVEYDRYEMEPAEETLDIYAADQNELGQSNQYGSILPSDMLIGEDEDPQVDLSVTMSSLISIKPGPKEESDDPRKEA